MTTENTSGPKASSAPFGREAYERMIKDLFVRFPSVQTSSFSEGYKPGLGRMLAFDSLLGHPSKAFRTIHIAGTNGKGSTSCMLSSLLMECGYRVGLYTSPHIEDFRERIRVDGEMVPREWVFDFLKREDVSSFMEEASLSFFEITTGMALEYFKEREVDIAVIETGLGGRLDSTNILTPILSVITSIAFDHMAYLGNTLGSIASEKAGILKPHVPAVVGRVPEEAWEVIREKATLTHSEIKRVTDGTIPGDNIAALWNGRETILGGMDLRGEYQRANLDTVLLSLGTLRETLPDPSLLDDGKAVRGIQNASRSMHLRGRWERASYSGVDCILDIGHNPQALEGNFSQLGQYLADGQYDRVCIIYAVMADKDLGSIIPLMPCDGRFSYVFTTPSTPRALPSGKILEKVISERKTLSEKCTLLPCDSLSEALPLSLKLLFSQSPSPSKPLLYIGGSTFAVADAIAILEKCP